MSYFRQKFKPLGFKTGVTCPPNKNNVKNISSEMLEIQSETYDGHRAIDLSTWDGSTIDWKPVLASCYGIVSEIGVNTDNRGFYIRIDTGKSMLEFCHFAEKPKHPIELGFKVNPSSVIGFSGASGGNYTPHLHIRMDVYGVGTVDPYPYLKQGGEEVPTDYTTSDDTEVFVSEKDETGTYHFTKRDYNPVYPSIEDAIKGINIVANYVSGEDVVYDKVIDTNKYRYISYIGGSGNRNYVMVRNLILNYQVGYAE